MDRNKMFDGRGKVIIRTISAQTILGKEYAAGDVLVSMSDIKTNLSYTQVANIASRKGEALVANTSALPLVLELSEIKNNKMLEKLLYRPIDTKVSVTIENVFSSADLENNIGYINNNLKGVVSYLKVKSYNEKGETIESRLDGDTIIFNETFERAFCFIEAEFAATSYGLEKAIQPYVSIEIQIAGKIGSRSGLAIIKIPTAQLETNPNYDFGSDANTYGASLSYLIMNPSKEKPTLSFLEF